MLYFVYAVVIALCFMTFRSARAVACIILPLVLTSILGKRLWCGWVWCESGDLASNGFGCGYWCGLRYLYL